MVFWKSSLNGFLPKLSVFFPLFFKNHIVFQDQPEDCVGEDDIIDMTEVIVLSSMSLQYVMLC